MSDQLCEVPGCDRPAVFVRPQSSGDLVRVCGLPHIYNEPGTGWAASGVMETPSEKDGEQ